MGDVKFRRNGGAEKEIRALLDEQVAAIALQVEGQAKRNIQSNGQIDTGFMLNSVYAVTEKGSSYGKTRPDEAYVGRSGRMADRRRAREADLRGADALVGAAAEYAIWQELRQSFLFKALEQVQGRMGR